MLQKPYQNKTTACHPHETCNKIINVYFSYVLFTSGLLLNNYQVVSISSLVHKEWKQDDEAFRQTKLLGEKRRTKQRSAKGRLKRPEIIERNGSGMPKRGQLC